MKISIITLFPKMISGFSEESIIKRAIEKKLVEIEIINLRDFAIDDYGTVDDRPYGGGAGMILRIEPIYKALQFVILNKVKDLDDEVVVKKQKGAPLDSSPMAQNDKWWIVLTSPKGKAFNQEKAQKFSRLDHLIIIAGHYEDVDARVSNFIDEEISMGDFVLTGGEIVAAGITDALVRLIPGVLKKDNAVTEESFNLDGKKLLEYPQFTRPEDFMGLKVPEILLKGDHKKIKEWQKEKSLEETIEKRPDLLIDKQKK